MWKQQQDAVLWMGGLILSGPLRYFKNFLAEDFFLEAEPEPWAGVTVS
jgi:hypothetical protein